MGADLYIKTTAFDKARKSNQRKFDAAVKKRDALKPQTPQYDAADKEVDRIYNALYGEDPGYFRDSYNATSVLWRLGLSWWQDVGKLTTKTGNLRGANLKKFLAMVKKAKMKPVTMAELGKMGARVGDGDNSPDKWDEFYKGKRKRLIEFLERAVKLRAPISCSL